MNKYSTSTLIKQLRGEHEFTIEKVAKLLGVSKAAVSKWENGDFIKTEHLYDLAKLYNVTFSELNDGKLNHEGSSSFWKRNYDLSSFDLEDDILNKNDENLKSFFEHCVRVKNKFFQLLPRWAKDELSKQELEEFDFVKQYFSFDNTYRSYICQSLWECDYDAVLEEKEFIVKVLKVNSSSDKESYLWELSKLYLFTYDFHQNAILESGDLKALEYMMSFCSQIEKDVILYNLVTDAPVENGLQKFNRKKYKSLDDIEKSPSLRVILNSGANVLFSWQIPDDTWDKGMLDAVEGKKVQVMPISFPKYHSFPTSHSTGIYHLDFWKLNSYKEYCNYIDRDTTEHFKDVVNYKDKDPLKYFENILERNRLDR